MPSYVYKKDLSISIDGLGEVKLDIAFGGAFYAYVDNSQFEIDLSEKNSQELIRIGMKIKHAVMKQIEIIASL